MRVSPRSMGLLSISLAIAGTADAQTPQPSPGDVLRSLIQLDADGDRSISRGEVPESARDSFDVVLRHGDTDQNGQISDEEVRALLENVRTSGGGAETIARRFQRADRDQNGFVSRDEFQGPEALFDRLDTNQDGKLTREEAAGRPGAQPTPSTGTPPTPSPVGKPNSTPSARRLLRLDRNGDGQIQRTEYRGPAQLFDRLDANKDQIIDAGELKAVPQP